MTLIDSTLGGMGMRIEFSGEVRNWWAGVWMTESFTSPKLGRSVYYKLVFTN